MRGTVSITVGGGQASFGAVIQGDGNVVDDVTVTFSAMKEQILREAARHNENDERQRLLAEKVAELEQLAREQGRESQSKVHGLLDELKDGFVWILPIVQRFVELWFPTIGPGAAGE